MTINEFCAKYGVDRNTVYQSVWMIEKHSGGRRDIEYDEADILNAVRRTVRKRYTTYFAKLKDAEDLMKKVRL